jgi:hypothetical protein
MRQLSVLVLFLASCNSTWSQVTPMSEKEAVRIIKSMRVDGRVGGAWDGRVTSTDKSYNYKLRATWFTPKVKLSTGSRLSQERPGGRPRNACG